MIINTYYDSYHKKYIIKLTQQKKEKSKWKWNEKKKMREYLLYNNNNISSEISPTTPCSHHHCHVIPSKVHFSARRGTSSPPRGRRWRLSGKWKSWDGISFAFLGFFLLIPFSFFPFISLNSFKFISQLYALFVISIYPLKKKLLSSFSKSPSRPSHPPFPSSTVVFFITIGIRCTVCWAVLSSSCAGRPTPSRDTPQHTHTPWARRVHTAVALQHIHSFIHSSIHSSFINTFADSFADSFTDLFIDLFIDLLIHFCLSIHLSPVHMWRKRDEWVLDEVQENW